MTSEICCPRELSDADLLSEVKRASIAERRATANLVVLLMEVDSRRLYAGLGYSSLFTYCVQELHLSEHAAYLRIETARAARRFPQVLECLSDGRVHLTAISLLAPHLTDENHLELLESATHKSKRDVEQLVARVRPQPDAPSNVRKLPAPRAPAHEFRAPNLSETPKVVSASAVPASINVRPSIVKPLAPERYKVQFTVSGDTQRKLRRAQDLMRHIVPDGDLAAIFDRALTLLLANLSNAKCGTTERPRRKSMEIARSRRVPAAVRREVWRRDEGRCAFRGDQGRCAETGFLEFHHVIPYADGGAASANNIELRCRAHNQHEADLWTGVARVPQVRETRATSGA